ncbi:MAG: hypothetical protein Tsb0024_07230 [Ruegeria sp.]
MGNLKCSVIVRVLRPTLGDDADVLDLSLLADQLLGFSGAQVTARFRGARGLVRADDQPPRQRHLEATARRIAPPPDAISCCAR